MLGCSSQVACVTEACWLGLVGRVSEQLPAAGVFEEQDGDAAGGEVDAGFDAVLGVGDEGFLSSFRRRWSMKRCVERNLGGARAQAASP